jgi:hypothetical protein
MLSPQSDGCPRMQEWKAVQASASSPYPTIPGTILKNGLQEALESAERRVRSATLHPENDLLAEVATAFELDELVAGEVRAAVKAGEFPLVHSGNCNTSVTSPPPVPSPPASAAGCPPADPDGAGNSLSLHRRFGLQASVSPMSGRRSSYRTVAMSRATAVGR